MTLHIHNPEADRLAHEIASQTGKSIDEVVLGALRREQTQPAPAPAQTAPLEGEALYKALMEISEHCAALPVYDTRSAEEILGYDENGLPT